MSNHSQSAGYHWYKELERDEMNCIQCVMCGFLNLGKESGFYIKCKGKALGKTLFFSSYYLHVVIRHLYLTRLSEILYFCFSY